MKKSILIQLILWFKKVYTTNHCENCCKSLPLAIFLIIILGFGVYSNCLDGKFVWDDFGLVRDNPYIKSWQNIPEIFTKGIGGGGSSNFYRPVQMATYVADYSLWKFNPVGYHLTNTLLHILAALAIYWLINIIFCSRMLAFLTAALFVAFPVHTEAVSYIAGRADSLAVIFILLTLIFYIKSLPLARPRMFVLALFSCVFALLSKENSVIIPLLILLYHYAFKAKFKAKGFLLISFVVLGYAVLRLTVLKNSVPVTPIMLQRIPGFFVALAEYVRLLLLPFNLHMEYGDKLFSIFNLKAVLGMAAAVLLITIAVRERQRNKLVFFSISWFFLALLPVSNIYVINYSFMMEHWLYLPSIGFFLILAKGLCLLYDSGKFKYAAIVLATSILTSYACLTVEQNNYWREPVSFYKRALQFSPDSYRFLNELGLEYAQMKLNKEAIACYKKALVINPRLAGVCYNLGALYYSLGDDQQAISSLKKAVELAPWYTEAYFALGKAYCRANKKEEALSLYKKLVEIKPGLAAARLDSPCLYFK